MSKKTPKHSSIGLEQATYTRTTPNDMGELKPMQMPWLFKQNDKTPLPKGTERATETRTPNDVLKPIPFLLNLNQKMPMPMPKGTQRATEIRPTPKDLVGLVELTPMPGLLGTPRMKGKSKTPVVTRSTNYPNLLSQTPTSESTGPSKCKKPKIDSHIKKETRKELFKNCNKNEPKPIDSPRRKVPAVNKRRDKNISTVSSPKADSVSNDCDSENEFLLAEEQCLNSPSPVSSVCNLFKETNIQSAKKPALNSHDLSSIITGIKQLIDEEIADFNRTKLVHDKKIKSLQGLLNTLKENIDENIPNRRSQRLAHRNSPFLNTNTVSPALKKTVDLRKKALANNLSSNFSPKLTHALSEYSSVKKSFGYLETPKSEKTKKFHSAISSIVFQQAYKLQDTPAKKN